MCHTRSEEWKDVSVAHAARLRPSPSRARGVALIESTAAYTYVQLYERKEDETLSVTS